MEITIYTTQTCPFCVRAKAWLNERGYDFTEISLDRTQDREHFKMANPGLKTVPQIFVNQDGKRTHIGGFSDLSGSLLDRG